MVLKLVLAPPYLSDEEATIVGTYESSTIEACGGMCPAFKLVDGLGLDGLFGPPDGSASDVYGCAHTDFGSIQWFSLELESPKKITRVQIVNRVYFGKRGQNVQISIGPSKAYDPNEPLCLPEISELSIQPGLQDYLCTGDLHEGKFVKISRAGVMNLCEVKIFIPAGKVPVKRVASCLARQTRIN